MITQHKEKDADGRIQKAGGLVVRRQDGQVFVALVYREKKGDWTFPKGHLESGEGFESAARREIFEECGVEVDLVTELPAMNYVTNKGNGVYCKMFLCRPKSVELVAERVGDKAEWVALADVYFRLTHKNLQDYFLRVERLLSESV
jgi:8-oxo-dGTP pyrophosphatase MutT (NUDIX family)